MKQLFFLFLLAVSQPLGASAQVALSPLAFPTDSASGKVLYEAVVPVPGVSQAALYDRAQDWFVNNFKAYKQVVGVEDPVNGKIVGTYCSILSRYFMLTYTPVEIWRTFKVYVKDGRYRYELSEWGLREVNYGRGVYPFNPKDAGELRRFGQEVRQQAQRDTESLRVAMANPKGGIAGKKDW